MNQAIARTFGGVFVLIGVIGFFSGSMTMATGNEFGVFPVNVVHNVVHILIGLWGLNSARTEAGAAMYGKVAGAIFILLGIAGLGLLSAERPLGGFMPLGGYDHLLHFVAGGVLVLVGFFGGSREG
jgi:hypothetical protein